MDNDGVASRRIEIEIATSYDWLRSAVGNAVLSVPQISTMVVRNAGDGVPYRVRRWS